MDTVPTKTVDYLEQDPLIRGQRFACVSFVSPEDVLASRDVFLVGKFMSSVADDVKGMLDSLGSKFASDPEVQETIRLVRNRHEYMWSDSAIQAEYSSFKSARESELDEEFHRANGFRTTVRGLKIRGVYDTVDDATARAVAITKFDDKFHVYIAEVGCWCPWSPYPEDIKNGEYAETELNTLMKKYNEALESKTEVYEQRKREMVQRMGDEKEVWLEKRKQELERFTATAESPSATAEEPSVTTEEPPSATVEEPPSATVEEPPSATVEEPPSATTEDPSATTEDPSTSTGESVGSTV